MNTNQVVHETCIRGCDVEDYEGPWGARKLLDNGDFWLATREHQKSKPIIWSFPILVSKWDILQARPIIRQKQVNSDTSFYL